MMYYCVWLVQGSVAFGRVIIGCRRFVGAVLYPIWPGLAGAWADGTVDGVTVAQLWQKGAHGSREFEFSKSTFVCTLSFSSEYEDSTGSNNTEITSLSMYLSSVRKLLLDIALRSVCL